MAALTAAKQLLDIRIGDDFQHFSVFGGSAAIRRNWTRRALWPNSLLTYETVRMIRFTGWSNFPSALDGSILHGRNSENWNASKGLEGCSRPSATKQLSYRFGYDATSASYVIRQ